MMLQFIDIKVFLEHPKTFFVFGNFTQITRKIIRKCVSADGVESEEVSFEGDARASLAVHEEGGYPKVTKRTVLKSEGGHTEVFVILHQQKSHISLDGIKSFF